jgi:hypothetical protein
LVFPALANPHIVVSCAGPGQGGTEAAEPPDGEVSISSGKSSRRALIQCGAMRGSLNENAAAKCLRFIETGFLAQSVAT